MNLILNSFPEPRRQALAEYFTAFERLTETIFACEHGWDDPANIEPAQLEHDAAWSRFVAC